MTNQEFMACIERLKKLHDYITAAFVYYDYGASSIRLDNFRIELKDMETIFLYDKDKLLLTIDEPVKLDNFIKKLYIKDSIKL